MSSSYHMEEKISFETTCTKRMPTEEKGIAAADFEGL